MVYLDLIYKSPILGNAETAVWRDKGQIIFQNFSFV